MLAPETRRGAPSLYRCTFPSLPHAALSISCGRAPAAAAQKGETPMDKASDATRAAVRNATAAAAAAQAEAAAAAQRVAAAECAAREAEARAAAVERQSAAVLSAQQAAAAAAHARASASVPADVAALLSSLSLSAYAAPLCAKLGMTCAADAALLTDAHLESIDMRPLERCKLMRAAAAAAASAAAAAAAPMGVCDVMISYRVPETGASGDKSVFVLRDALQARGFRVFVGESAIEGGASWPATIQRGVEDCQAFVILCSSTYGDAVVSPWTQRELVMADNLRKPLIPVWHSGPYPPKAVAIYLGGTQRIPVGNLAKGYVESKVAHATVADEVAAALARAGVTPRGGQVEQQQQKW
jgi:hypothetical protein